MASKVELSDADRGMFVPGELKPFSLSYDGRRYEVIGPEGYTQTIGNERLDKELRGISAETLTKMTEVGYISVRRSGESFALDFSGRVPGGGLLSALAVYVGTNVVGGAMVIGGMALAPVSGGASLALVAAGTATITAAPTTFLVTLPVPAP